MLQTSKYQPLINPYDDYSEHSKDVYGSSCPSLFLSDFLALTGLCCKQVGRRNILKQRPTSGQIDGRTDIFALFLSLALCSVVRDQPNRRQQRNGRSQSRKQRRRRRKAVIEIRDENSAVWLKDEEKRRKKRKLPAFSRQKLLTISGYTPVCVFFFSLLGGLFCERTWSKRPQTFTN